MPRTRRPSRPSSLPLCDARVDEIRRMTPEEATRQLREHFFPMSEAEKRELKKRAMAGELVIRALVGDTRSEPDHCTRRQVGVFVDTKPVDTLEAVKSSKRSFSQVVRDKVADALAKRSRREPEPQPINVADVPFPSCAHRVLGDLSDFPPVDLTNLDGDDDDAVTLILPCDEATTILVEKPVLCVDVQVPTDEWDAELPEVVSAARALVGLRACA